MDVGAVVPLDLISGQKGEGGLVCCGVLELTSLSLFHISLSDKPPVVGV